MNKLQKFIVWLFRIPTIVKQEKIINTINPEIKSNVEVIRVNDSNDDVEFIEELGLTIERYTELCNIADASNGELVTDCMIKISKECKHPNELAILCYMLGRSTEFYSNPLNIIKQLNKK